MTVAAKFHEIFDTRFQLAIIGGLLGLIAAKLIGSLKRRAALDGSGLVPGTDSACRSRRAIVVLRNPRRSDFGDRDRALPSSLLNAARPSPNTSSTNSEQKPPV
jgi:hypothetical protein